MTDASQERAFGRIEAKVDSLIEDRSRNESFRKAVYGKLESIERKQTDADRQIKSLDNRVADTEQTTAEYRSLKSMGRGWLIGAAFGGGGIALWAHDAIMNVLKAVKGG